MMMATPMEKYEFDGKINQTPTVGVDFWGQPEVNITLPDGTEMGYRASEIVAMVSPRSYERALRVVLDDMARRAV